MAVLIRGSRSGEIFPFLGHKNIGRGCEWDDRDGIRLDLEFRARQTGDVFERLDERSLLQRNRDPHVLGIFLTGSQRSKSIEFDQEPNALLADRSTRCPRQRSAS